MQEANKLKQYLGSRGIKQRWFAAKAGISEKTVSCICKGQRCAHLTAVAVEYYTDGKVRAKDLCHSKNHTPNNKQL